VTSLLHELIIDIFRLENNMNAMNKSSDRWGESDEEKG
jgi:hypothetical protein